MINVLNFQLTSSQGGWHRCYRRNANSKKFSTHILTRRMTIAIYCCRMFFVFSTHILTRRMTFPSESESSPAIFQLTSSQGGWRYIDQENDSWQDFSTHILTRRMTAWTVRILDARFFQLTSSQGGWHRLLKIWHHLYFFNSHPHKEDDG